jgi:hypothetical protein
MTGPVDVYVDLDALNSVQQELTTLLNALTGVDNGEAAKADAESMGSPMVAAAVQRFAQNWAEGRDVIVENLQACQRYAASAVATYSQTEAALSQAGAAEGSAPP